jgi:hypothetical protein
MSRFRALKDLDTYAHYNAFKGLDVWNGLDEIHQTNDSAAEGPIADLIEYSVLSWLGKNENLVGFEPNEQAHQLQGFTSGGRPAQGLVLQPVRLAVEPNPLLAALEPQLSLPVGSSVQRHRTPSPSFRTLRIETRQSTLVLALQRNAVHPFVSSRDDVGRRIRENLQLELETPHSWIHYLSMRFEFTQRAKSRFSDQAKKERLWAVRLLEQFEENYSWERLSLRYGQL